MLLFFDTLVSQLSLGALKEGCKSSVVDPLNVRSCRLKVKILTIDLILTTRPEGSRLRYITDIQDDPTAAFTSKPHELPQVGYIYL